MPSQRLLAPAIALVAARFTLPTETVDELVTLPAQDLRARDAYCPPSNTSAPTLDFPRWPLGTAKIGSYGEHANSYIEYLRALPPTALTPTEPEDGIRQRDPSYRLYVEWFRAGIVAPPIFVAPSDRGDGKLLSSNRRRVLAAQEAGVEQMLAWFSPTNAETGLPLKYGDVTRAYAEAIVATAPLAEPPVLRYRLHHRGANYGSLLPPVGSHFTADERLALKQWLAAHRFSVTDNGASIRINAPDTAMMSALPDGLDLARQRRTAQQSAARDSDRADKEAQRLAEIAANPATPWVVATFGEGFTNPYNQLALVRYLNGDADRFNGLIGPSWVTGIEALGHRVEEFANATQDEVLALIKDAYQRDLAPAPSP